jgi:hypothetical protein
MSEAGTAPKSQHRECSTIAASAGAANCRARFARQITAHFLFVVPPNSIKQGYFLNRHSEMAVAGSSGA